MKKTITVLLLIITFFLLCSCENENITDPNNAETAETLTEKDNTVSSSHNSAESIYLPFDKLLDDVTDIVIAEFRGVDRQGELNHYNFYVIESLRGQPITTSIAVQSLPTDCYISDAQISYSTYNLEYTVGTSYLLLLERYTSVYSESASFSFVSDSLIIPLSGSDNAVNAATATLYGTPLTNHVQSKSLAAALDEGTFVKYILSATEENPYNTGAEYVGETDLESVIAGSEYVFEVKVDSLFMESYTGDRITYNCTLIESYKGEIQNEYICVIFPINTVQVGDTCIVAVNDESGSQLIFLMSSKNSVFDLSRRNEILEIINK